MFSPISFLGVTKTKFWRIISLNSIAPFWSKNLSKLLQKGVFAINLMIFGQKWPPLERIKITYINTSYKVLMHQWKLVLGSGLKYIHTILFWKCWKSIPFLAKIVLTFLGYRELCLDMTVKPLFTFTIYNSNLLLFRNK